MVSDLGQEPKGHFLIHREVCGPRMGQMWAKSGPQSKTPTWWLAFTTALGRLFSNYSVVARAVMRTSRSRVGPTSYDWLKWPYTLNSLIK